MWCIENLFIDEFTLDWAQRVDDFSLKHFIWMQSEDRTLEVWIDYSKKVLVNVRLRSLDQFNGLDACINQFYCVLSIAFECNLRGNFHGICIMCLINAFWEYWVCKFVWESVRNFRVIWEYLWFWYWLWFWICVIMICVIFFLFKSKHVYKFDLQFDLCDYLLFP